VPPTSKTGGILVRRVGSNIHDIPVVIRPRSCAEKARTSNIAGLVRTLQTVVAMTHRRHAILAASTMAAALLTWNTASACSAPSPARTTAYPVSGASDVSTMTSIKLILGAQRSPATLSLTGANTTISLAGAQSLGSGFHNGGHGSFWLFSQALSPSTEYVVTDSSTGSPVELTRFTTAAGYDKIQGPSATLGSLRLWRVRYPVSQIAAGGCIFAEYEGYIELNFPAVTLPNTPAEEVVQVVQLTPRTGGLTQSMVYSGNATRLGTALDGNGWPAPHLVTWKPELAPDRDYCATITFYGRNDLALLPLQSSTICAPVTSLDRSNDFGTPGNTGSSGDSIWDGGVPPGLVNPADLPESSSSCSFDPSSKRPGLWFVIVAAALAGRLRRTATRQRR
jgi:hypothetical protein